MAAADLIRSEGRERKMNPRLKRSRRDDVCHSSNHKFPRPVSLNEDACSVRTFFPIHCTYFCVCCTDGAARINFSSVYLSQNKSPFGGGLFPCMSEREREVRRKKKKKKKAQKKPLRRDRDLNPQTLAPEPSVLSTRPQRPAPAMVLSASPS